MLRHLSYSDDSDQPADLYNLENLNVGAFTTHITSLKTNMSYTVQELQDTMIHKPSKMGVGGVSILLGSHRLDTMYTFLWNKNQKWDPLRAMKTFIRRKMGYTT